MRARNIKPGFFLNCELSEVDIPTRMLFIGLWCYADREGRFEWKPKQIKAAIFPYDNVNIEKMLKSLLSLNVITCHSSVGYIENFKKHQHPHPHEAKSLLPEKHQQNQCNDMSLHVTECKEDVRMLGCYDSLIPDVMINDSLIDDINPLSVLPAKQTPPYQKICDEMNLVLGTRYKNTETFKKLIRARINDGFTPNEFKIVCENMKAAWGSDLKMMAYLRPETLFGGKMNSYLGGNAAGPVSERQRVNFAAGQEFLTQREANVWTTET